MMEPPHRLSDAYYAEITAIRKRLQAFAGAYWDDMAVHNGRAVQDMLDALIPLVQAGQVRADTLTRAYLAQMAKELGWGTPGDPTPPDVVASPRGIDPTVLYTRPVSTVNARLAEGATVGEAVQAGRIRLLEIIGTDIALVQRKSAHHAWRDSQPKGGGVYRRVLKGDENCGLCVIASTQRYRVDHVDPIHPGCDCGFEPLPPGTPPGVHIIDPDTLAAAHDSIEAAIGAADRSGRGPDYRKIKLTRRVDGTFDADPTELRRLIRVREHGEYGPTLTWAHQDFTGPKRVGNHHRNGDD